jgi:uncharacterized protein YjiS (DUF1127 family)
MRASIAFLDDGHQNYSFALLNRGTTSTTNGLMEVSMLEDTKFDLSAIDVQALSPEQWSVLKSRLVEQARQQRNAEIRAGIARVFAGPEKLLGAISRPFRRSWRALEVARRRRAAVTALSALDDRSLRDIGLRRGEILSAVYQPRPARRG